MTDHNETTSLRLLGVDHRDLPLRARREVAWDAERTGEVLRRFAHRHPGSGLLVLATCTRTELYVDAVDDHGAAVHDVLAATPGVAGCPALRGLWFELAGADVAGHLFRVAVGLQSSILGDTQLAGQMRRAADAARAAGTLSPLLAEVTRRALRLGRTARRDTAISDGGADIGTVAVESARIRLGLVPGDRPVLVIGAGQVARSVVDALHAAGLGPVLAANRTTTVAVGGGVTVHDLAAVPALLERARLVINTVPPAAAVLDDDGLARARLLNPGLGAVDLAGASGLGRGDPRVLSLDDLCDHPSPRRLAAVPAVDGLCDRAVRDWTDWLRRRPLEHAIGHLYRELAQLDLPLGRLDRRAVNTVLHHHIVRLRKLDFRPVEPTRGEGHQRSLSPSNEL